MVLIELRHHLCLWHRVHLRILDPDGAQHADLGRAIGNLVQTRLKRALATCARQRGRRERTRRRVRARSGRETSRRARRGAVSDEGRGWVRRAGDDGYLLVAASGLYGDDARWERAQAVGRYLRLRRAWQAHGADGRVRRRKGEHTP